MNEETKKKREIDYYIFIDYSDDLIGYNIFEKEKVYSILPKIVKFRHYKEERHKRTYLLKIKKEIKSSNLMFLLLKQKIKYIKDNLLIFAEVSRTTNQRLVECSSVLLHPVVLEHAQEFSLIQSNTLRHQSQTGWKIPDIIEFIRKNDNCLIFMSIDNNQFRAFNRLLDMIPHKDNIIVRKESDLKRDSPEYRLSLIIDTMLNIERMSK